MWTKVAAPLLLLALRASGVSIDVENGVYKLQESTFDTVVNRFPAVMVKFYAPWCGHCKKMAPDFESAARKLKKLAPSESTGARLAKVDATAEEALAKKHDVSGYPTLLVFQGGALFGKYEGGRDKADFVGFMQAMVTEPAALGFAMRYYALAFGVYKDILRKIGVPGGIRKYLFKGFPVVVGMPFIFLFLFKMCCRGSKKKKQKGQAATAEAGKKDANGKRPKRSDSPAPKDEAKEPKKEEEKKDD